MSNFAHIRSLQILSSRTGPGTAAFMALILFLPSLLPRRGQSVQAELAQIQKGGGYHLVAMQGNNVFTVSFADGSLAESKPLIEKGSAMYGTVSPDGRRVAMTVCLNPGLTHPQPNVTDCPGGLALAIVGTDGSNLREYPEFANPGPIYCWSHDMSKLVLLMDDRRHPARMPLS